MLLLLACHPPSPSDTPDSKGHGAPADDSVPTVSGSWGDVLITEAMSENHGTLEDGDGDTSDWLELYNPGPDAVDLAGWSLSDSGDAWTLPAVTLVPGEYRVVFASGKGDAGPAGELHASFQLSSAGEPLTLLAPDGSVIATLTLPALGPDVSWGLGQTVVTTTPVADGSVGTWSPTAPAGWADPSFDDSAWAPVTLPMGYDGPVAEGDEEDAAFGKAATQSSDGYGYTGVGAVDGDAMTFSHTADGDLTPWLAVDLARNYEVSTIRLLNRVDCCAERLYDITVTLSDSTGATVWTSGVVNPVASGEAPVSPGSQVELALPGGTVGARVTVTKAGYPGSEWLSLGELVVQGRPTGAYADRIHTDLGGGLGEAAARFPIPTETPPTRGTLEVDYDDGFDAWLDGAQVAAVPATSAHSAGEPGSFPVDASRLGSNSVLGLRVTNISADDDDLFLAATLRLDWIQTGEPAWMQAPTPGEPNDEGVPGFVDTPTFDPPRGFYDATQTVTITCPTPGATLVYTLDGSTPTLDHGTHIAPASGGDAPVATLDVPTTAIVRAAGFREGWGESATATQTYLFLADVIHQPAAPAGFPTIWNSQSEGPYAADYAMDPDVVDDPAYHDDLLAGLREIPTLSVVLAPEDLFGDNGIYTNSADRGDAWTRRASFELILPDGTTGFQQDADLQIHGYGWRYHSSTLKHSFRIQFQSEYGASKLEYPLFSDSEASRFDSIVLRAGGSKTFLDFRDPEMAQYIHDAFARDTARDMGKVDGHATYVHLYLNGLYWGLYMPVERPDAGFAEEAFGGDDSDYDAINRRTTTNEAIDGDLDAWNHTLALADADLNVQANYDALCADLDVDALIDYMLIHQYMTNMDGPCCFESNNMRGTRERADAQPWTFYVWDMEYSLWYPTDSYNVDVDVPGSVSHVYARLRTVAAFRTRYAERAALQLGPGGPLSADVAAARYEARAAEIFDPIVGESARWGDTYRDTPYTRDAEWQTEHDRLMNDFFPQRTHALIGQLRAAGLYAP